MSAGAGAYLPRGPLLAEGARERLDDAASRLLARRPELARAAPAFKAAARLMLGRLAAGGTLFVCGNGGSAADADHIAGELAKGFLSARPLGAEAAGALSAAGGLAAELAPRLQRGLRAVSLSANAALMSAIANDQGYELVFAQQLLALARPGDLLLCLSTSGRSASVRAASELAGAIGVAAMALAGPARCPLDDSCEPAIHCPGRDAGEIQDAHRAVYHALCAYVEAELFDI